MDDTNSDVVFFERHGTYRTWPCILGLTIFGTVATVGLVVMVLSVIRLLTGEEQLDSPWGVVFATVWEMAMLGAALMLGYLVIFKPETHARIDDKGISVDSRHWPWEKVKWVFTKRSGNGRYLCFQKRGFGPDRYLHPWPPLSPEEAEQILDALDEYTQQRFPDVRIG